MKMKRIQKKYKNSSGDILVRQTNTCGIVEMIHLFDKNQCGYVIGCWRIKKSDEENIAEFCSIGSRITETDYDNADILLKAMIFGQKLADLLVDLSVENN